MGTPKEKPMSLRRDPGRDMRDSIHNPQFAAQTQIGGKPRLIDISETGEYKKVTIEMSPRLKKRLDFAVKATDTTSGRIYHFRHCAEDRRVPGQLLAGLMRTQTRDATTI